MGIFSSIFGGGDTKMPATQQTIQTSKLAPEIAPFAEEILTDAQKLYLAQMEKGHTPYTGESIAPLTPEQLQAQEGLKDLIGIQRPLQDEALAQFRTGVTEKFTPEMAQEYMSPYQRAVTDIEKRESQRAFESQTMPAFEKLAVGAGGMSGLGTRAGVQAAELGRAQMQRLGDIETKGLQSAYKDAQNLFTQQQARERTAALDIARLAPQITAGGLSEQGLLQTIGEDKQALGQQALNEAYFKYLEEQDYASDKLAEYSGFVYGNPLMSNRSSITTSPAPSGPSTGSQLMGLGLTAAKMYGQGGGFGNDPQGFSWGNLFSMNKAEGGGLSSLPVVYRQNGGGYTGGAAMQGPFIRNPKTGEAFVDWEDTDQAEKERVEGRAATIAAHKRAERADKEVSPPGTLMSRAEALIARQRKAVEGRQAFSPEEIQRREREDANKLQELLTGRGEERKTASQDYQDRMEEARKRTFEAQRGLVPTGHPGYQRAMKSLLRGTAAGAPRRGLLESFLDGTRQYLEGVQAGDEAKQKALAKIEERRGTAEMGDIEEYEKMEAADEAAAFKNELTMIKDINPALWKSIQKRLDKNAKAGMDEAASIAAIMAQIAKRDLDLAKAAKEGTGVKIKAADYNAAGTMFDRMIDMAKFDGPRDKNGRLTSVTMIGKRAIKPKEAAQLRKILAGTMRMVRDGDMVAASRFAQEGIDKMMGPKEQTPKYKIGDIVTKTRNGKVGKYEYLGPNKWREVESENN